MRVIRLSESAATSLRSHEKLFVELWYGMTHMLSLDSYRVRCMNARSIATEVNEELATGRLSDVERESLCQEALEIWDHDPVMHSAFPGHLEVVRPALKAAPDGKKNGAAELRYCVADIAAVLQRDYFRELLELMPGAIKPGNEQEIHTLLNAFLSSLIEQGWPLESLFHSHRHFLVQTGYSFSKNLRFLLEVYKKQPIQFRVTLKLHGSEKLRTIQEYGIFRFSDTAPDAGASPEVQKFASAGKAVTFAECALDAFNHLSAAFTAREAFEELMDLLRFGFEQDVLRIAPDSLVLREEDAKLRIVHVENRIPNPQEKTDRVRFQRFTKRLNSVVSRSGIEGVSRRQLQAAIRHYRFGRDSEDLRDKFMNWWMGLEALASTGRGGIGETVTRNVSRAMVVPYAFRLLRDLMVTLKYCQIEWDGQLPAKSGCDDLSTLSVSQLLSLLQSEAAQDELWQRCEGHPVVAFRGRAICEWVSSPTSFVAGLESHLRHLEWHLRRLYRIRCRLIHGSDVRFHLGLFAANLEYYLRRAILFVLDAFHEHDHVASLGEVFGRSELTYDRVVASLKKEGAGDREIRAAVFAGVVLEEPHFDESDVATEDS